LSIREPALSWKSTFIRKSLLSENIKEN
jgi:hypothetical protein